MADVRQKGSLNATFAPPAVTRRKTVRADGSYHGACTVAVFDILGFKELARSRSLDELEGIVGRRFAENTTLAARVGGAQHWVSRFKPAPCIAITFADTVLLCSPDAGERGFVSVVTASLGLMGGCLVTGILLRGAITSGSMHVSADRTRYFGEAMVRAHELEKEQEWAGAILDESRLPRPPHAHMTTEVMWDGATVRYPVPRKGDTRVESLCLNWAPFPALQGNMAEHLLRHAPTSEPRALRKQANTVEFYEWARAQWTARHRGGPFMDTSE